MEEESYANVEANDKQENRSTVQEAEGNYFLDDSSDDDEFMVTIGEIRSTPSRVSHQLQQQQSDGQAVRVDLDATPLCNGSVIYDLDLASMVDKPWKKPGANITDYFNYGFNEDTWNQYCERQKKYRTQYGDQSVVNRAILDEIHLPSDSSPILSSFTGGRQLLSIVGGDKPQPRARRMVIPLRPVQSDVTPLDDKEAAYVSQNEAQTDNENRATNSFNSLSMSSILCNSTAIAGSPENAINKPNMSTPQDFSVPPPFDFSKPPPIDFTKPPPIFLTPSSFESGSFSSLSGKNTAPVIGELHGCDVSASTTNTDGEASIFPISAVSSSNFQQVSLSAARLASQSIVEAPPGLDADDVSSIAPIPCFPTQFKKEWLEPVEEKEFGSRKRTVSPDYKNCGNELKRSKIDEEKPPGVDDEEEAMASVFQKAFVCKHEENSTHKKRSRDDKGGEKSRDKNSRHSEKKNMEESQDADIRHSRKKGREKLRDGVSIYSDKKHKKSRTSDKKG